MEPIREGSGASSKQRRPYIKCHWTVLEDDLLVKLVEEHGPGKWEFIARQIEGRTGKSCRLRWMNHLDPNLKKTPFTAAEQARLLELQQDFGNKWASMVHFFPGRTDNQLKNQYHILVKTRFFKNAAQYASSEQHHGSGSINEDSSAAVPIVSPLSSFPHPVTDYCGFPSSFNDIQQDTQTMPLTWNDPSSYARAVSFYSMGRFSPNSLEGVNGGGNMFSYGWEQRGDSLMTNAKSNVTLELFPVSKPDEGIGGKNVEFIDFLGIGGSSN